MTGLGDAYALDGPHAVRRLYAGWAQTYDADFAAGMDYRLPAEVARAFLAAGGTGPVLDVGAGTGLLGAALRGFGFAGAIDGVDLSPEMLALAARRGPYRALFAADVTQALPQPGPWAGVVSSGTFTHGHLGPQPLALLAAAAPGALFALSVNAGVWDALGFPQALDSLGARDLRLQEVPIYGPAAAARDPAHAADRALIAVFRGPA
jgi:predicted TPR repeat methyltransferase